NPLDSDSEGIVTEITKSGRQALLVLNKIDLVKPPALLETTARLNAGSAFSETFMVSALTGDGLNRIKERLMAMMPASPFMFPPDDVSDMPNRLLAAEITR